MQTSKEGVLVITDGKNPMAMVRRHPDGHWIFYKTIEMGAEDIEELLENNNDLHPL